MKKHHFIIGCVLLAVITVGAFRALDSVQAEAILVTDGTASPNTVSTVATTYTITFTPVTPIPNGGEVRVEFPNEYATSFASITNADVSVTGTNISSTVETFDYTNNRVISTLTTTGDVSTTITIVIGDSAGGLNDLENPSAAGLYGVSIDTFDASDTYLDNGFAFIEIDDTVPVSASVTESMVMSLSNSELTYVLDPGVNNGQDKAQITTINVVTNASSGYTISGVLDDGSGQATLRSGASTIPSSDNASATDNDNYFGYTARNDGTGSTNDAENAFSNVSTVLTADGANNLGLGTSTPGQDHTIRYDLNIDYLTPSGFYSGTVTYTVSATF